MVPLTCCIMPSYYDICSLIYVKTLIILANSIQILVHFYSKLTPNFTDLLLGRWFSSEKWFTQQRETTQRNACHESQKEVSLHSVSHLVLGILVSTSHSMNVLSLVQQAGKGQILSWGKSVVNSTNLSKLCQLILLKICLTIIWLTQKNK